MFKSTKLTVAAVTMKKLVISVGTILLLCTHVLSVVSISNATIYEYEGNVFTYTHPTLGTSFEGSRITGFVEIDLPIGGQTVTLFESWSFSAGPITLTSTTPGVEVIPISAQLSEDAPTFTLWNFYVFLPGDVFIETTFDGQHFPSHTSSIDLVGTFPPDSYTLAKVGPDDPGIWTRIPEPPPCDIDAILTFFNESVDNETLYGRGRGWIAKLRLCVMRWMLEVAGEFIDRDRINKACFMLERAYKRCDGQRRPRDFVVGEATEELADMIHDLAASLGCEWLRPEYDVVVYSYTDEEGKHWINIELKDDEGKPMPFEDYIIYLPDGTVAEGTLDENGRARERLDKPGTCHIIFPNLDKEAWERV